METMSRRSTDSIESVHSFSNTIRLSLANRHSIEFVSLSSTCKHIDEGDIVERRLNSDTIVRNSDELADVRLDLESPHSRTIAIRWWILTLSCMLMFGNFYAYDLPASLNKPLQSYLNVTDEPYQYQLNLLYSLYSLPNIIIPFFGGYLVDRFGTKRLMTFLSFLVCVGQLLFTFGVTYRNFFIMQTGRIVFGLGGESLSVAQTRITAKWFKGKELAFALGINISVSRLGTVLTDFLSPFLAFSVSIPVALWAGFMMCLISMACGIGLNAIDEYGKDELKRVSLSSYELVEKGSDDLSPLQSDDDNKNSLELGQQRLRYKNGIIENSSRETLIHAEDNERVKKSLSLIAALNLSHFPLPFWQIVLVMCLMFATVIPFNTILAALLQLKWYHGNPKKAAQIMAIPDITSAILVPFVGTLVDKYGRRSLILFTCGLSMAVVHLLLGFLPTDYLTSPIPVLMVLGFSYSLLLTFWPCIPLVVPDDYVATAFGLAISAQNLALTIFPIVVAWLVTRDISYRLTDARMVVVISTRTLFAKPPRSDYFATVLSDTPPPYDLLIAPDDADAAKHFTLIARTLFKAKKCVIIVGAGISVAAGIPDFRSADGLYNLVKSRYPSTVVKGKDLFDASLFRDPVSTSIFYSFIAELKILSDAAHLTRTHDFIKRLSTTGKLLRCYTQVLFLIFIYLIPSHFFTPPKIKNIDCLESRLNLAPPPTKSSQTPSTSKGRAPVTPLPQLVHLHGALDTLICTICKSTVAFANGHITACQSGKPPACDACATSALLRESLGKRTLATGVLRPNIVLYGEHHAEGENIAKCVSSDVRKRPDVVVVMGTSLKVDGIKVLVRDLAKSVKAARENNSSTGGIVVLFNRTRLGKEWDGVFDYQVLGDVDDCVELVEREFLKLETIGSGKKGNSGATGNLKITQFMKSVKEGSTAPQSSLKSGSGGAKSNNKIDNQENGPPIFHTIAPVKLAIKASALSDSEVSLTTVPSVSKILEILPPAAEGVTVTTPRKSHGNCNREKFLNQKGSETPSKYLQILKLEDNVEIDGNIHQCLSEAVDSRSNSAANAESPTKKCKTIAQLEKFGAC
ncbi:hypothetical protein HK100_007007 [Physocladia obscura]|uniref:Lysosomal dipeptide transporter MFSD1 n=1 Tax=Physocladia obscura TaxID=109957 RepID=A0AAD5TAT8_9FUNG|nr:hypothetical protein HK100_007007 [Physocladia obscura]